MSSFTQEDVARVAAGLTKAQREFLLTVPQYAVETYAPAKWMSFKGLIEKREGSHRYTATPFGEAVRNHLKETQK